MFCFALTFLFVSVDRDQSRDNQRHLQDELDRLVHELHAV
jgi:hypothetical protein